MKVMIVDDHEPMRRMIRSFIADVVDEFVECPDGCQALETYTQHLPDVVVMDIKMKTMDGITATRNIKSQFPNAFVVIVSQWDSCESRSAAESAGVGAYFSKLDLAPLREMLKTMPRLA